MRKTVGIAAAALAAVFLLGLAGCSTRQPASSNAGGPPPQKVEQSLEVQANEQQEPSSPRKKDYPPDKETSPETWGTRFMNRGDR